MRSPLYLPTRRALPPKAYVMGSGLTDGEAPARVSSRAGGGVAAAAPLSLLVLSLLLLILLVGRGSE